MYPQSVRRPPGASTPGAAGRGPPALAANPRGQKSPRSRRQLRVFGTHR